MSEVYLSAIVGADGRATITLRPDGKQTWEVSQVSPELPGAPGNATGTVRKNGALIAPFEPAGDAVGGEPSVRLVLGDALTVEWTNCVPGSSARALFLYGVVS